MVSYDDYFAAKEKADTAHADLRSYAGGLIQLSHKLNASPGVRLKESSTSVAPDPGYTVVDPHELVTWERLAEVIRAFTAADLDFRRVDGELTPEQRKQVRYR